MSLHSSRWLDFSRFVSLADIHTVRMPSLPSSQPILGQVPVGRAWMVLRSLVRFLPSTVSRFGCFAGTVLINRSLLLTPRNPHRLLYALDVALHGQQARSLEEIRSAQPPMSVAMTDVVLGRQRLLMQEVSQLLTRTESQTWLSPSLSSAAASNAQSGGQFMRMSDEEAEGREEDEWMAFHASAGREMTALRNDTLPTITSAAPGTRLVTMYRCI